MGAQAESLAKTSGPPKRRFRNYLLDPRFQLKYTLMVVCVTVAVASVLGYFAYDYSRGQTELMTLRMAELPELASATVDDLEGEARKQDRQVLLSIVAGIVFLTLALGFTGILVTHKVVGPAYKLKLLLHDVAEGKLRLAGRLRKGDELQDLFEAFAEMVESLRDAQSKEVAAIDEAIEAARAAGVGEEGLLKILEVRDRMQAALD